MKIVYYEENHLLNCAKLIIKQYNNSHFNCDFTLESACSYLQELIFRPRFVGFLLLKKNQVIGFAFCHLRTWSTTNELRIDEFVIAEEFRRLGNGSKLLDFIYSYANNFSLTGITTTTNIIGQINFYQKNDFLEHDITFLYKGCKISD